jgi:hypothetical protein
MCHVTTSTGSTFRPRQRTRHVGFNVRTEACATGHYSSSYHRFLGTDDTIAPDTLFLKPLSFLSTNAARHDDVVRPRFRRVLPWWMMVGDCLCLAGLTSLSSARASATWTWSKMTRDRILGECMEALYLIRVLPCERVCSCSKWSHHKHMPNERRSQRGSGRLIDGACR